jgi:cytochrome c biogenesis protein
LGLYTSGVQPSAPTAALVEEMKGIHAVACSGETLPNASVSDVGRKLVSKGYEVFLKNGSLYAFKGIAGRFAPIGVHVALLAILGGAAYGALAGFEGGVMLPEGDQFLVAEALQSAPVALPGAPLPSGASGSIGQFRSVLSTLDLDGRQLGQQEIYVNQPLRFGGVTAYQVRSQHI